MASTSMRTTGRVMPMMAAANPTRLRPGSSGSSNESNRPPETPPERSTVSSGPPDAPIAPPRGVLPGLHRVDGDRGCAALGATHLTAGLGTGAGSRIGSGAGPEEHEVVGRLRHPLVDEAGEQRPGDDDRGDRDEDAEDEGAAEVRLEQADRGQRPGVRRHQPVQHRQAGQRRDADLHQRDAGALGDEDHDGHEEDDADLEEERQAEDGRDRRHHPGQPTGTDPADHGRDDAVRPSGVLEELADHRPERDEDADCAGCRAEAGDEALHGVARRHRRDRAEHGRAEHEGEEGVHLAPRDEHDHGEDAEDAREDELRVPGIHRWVVGGGQRGVESRQAEVTA